MILVTKGSDFRRPISTTNPLFAVLFFNVFLSVRFTVFFVIWDAQRLHFGHFLASFWEPWAIGK